MTMDLDFPPIVALMSIVASAFVMVMLLAMMRWPTIPAYFIAGVLTGPGVAGILRNDDAAHLIAELGVIFLLFTIGLKFSLGALRTIRRHVFWLGGAQTASTALLFGAPVWLWSGDAMLALLVGSAAAMSSTAIVSQILIDENIISAPAGARAMGVLLFQDLAVIPLIVIFSTGDGDASVLQTTAAVALKVAGIMAIVLFAGAPLMARWLNFVAGFGGRELYMLNLIMLIGLFSGLSFLAGLSYALGAFVAGILMSETLHRHRVSRIVEPFRHIFLGFFFMSLGALVDLEYLAENWPRALAAAALLVAVKAPLVYFCARMLGTHVKTASHVALLLCGAGEFGFVLLTLSRGSGIVEDSLFQLLLSANLIALIVAPFLWRKRDFFTRRLLANREWLTDAKKITDNLAQTARLSGHVVVCGFGRTGQAIAGILREVSVPYVALEENYQILQTVGSADNVIYAEAAGADGLVGANIASARAAIVAFIDPVDSPNAVRRARRMNPKLLIIARADTARFADELLAAGADEAFVDAHEFGFSAAKLLAVRGYGMRGENLARSISRARARENPFFTGEFGGAGDESPSAEQFAGCIARQEVPFLEAELNGCRVISWTREGAQMNVRDTRRAARIGDEFVLRGNAANLAAVKARLEDVAT